VAAGTVVAGAEAMAAEAALAAEEGASRPGGETRTARAEAAAPWALGPVVMLHCLVMAVFWMSAHGVLLQ
jgi:hypothetical protein